MRDAPAENELGAPPEPTAGLSAWWLAILLAVFYTMATIDKVILVHLVDYIKADLKLSDFRVSLVIGPAFAICFAVCVLPAGWAVDRFPRRWVLFLAVSTWSVATALGGIARSFEELILARMLVALGEAALMPAAISLLGDRFPPHKLATGVAIYNMGAKLGQSIAFVLAGITIAFAISISGTAAPVFGAMSIWQIVLITTGLPGVLLALLIFTVKEPRRRPAVIARGSQIDAGYLSFLKRERTLLIPLLGGFCAIAVVGFGLTAWVPSYLVREHDWNAVRYGPWLATVSLIGAATLIPKGWIIDWLFSRGMKDAALRFYTWLLLALTPLAFFVFYAPTPQLFIIGYGLLNAVALPYILYVSTTLHLVTPSQYRGRMLALMVLLTTLSAQGVGPTVIAALTDFVLGGPDQLGLALTIVTTSGMSLSLVLLRYTLRVMQRRDLSADEEPTDPVIVIPA